MDELQDAIEDAQYVNAIACVEDGPRPMLNWEFPTDEQLSTWKETKNAELSKYISEGRRTRRRSSYSRLNVDRSNRPARSSSVVGTYGGGGGSSTTTMVTAGAAGTTTSGSAAGTINNERGSSNNNQEGKTKSTMQTAVEAAAAAVAEADAAEEQKEEEETQNKQQQENGTAQTTTTTTNAPASPNRDNNATTTRVVTVDERVATSPRSGNLSPSNVIRLKAPPLESYEYICSQPLGFFLFAQYVKDGCNDYLRMNFVEDAILYRRVRGSHNREHRAKEIALTYLVDKTKTAATSASHRDICSHSTTMDDQGSLNTSGISTTQQQQHQVEISNNPAGTDPSPAAVAAGATTGTAAASAITSPSSSGSPSNNKKATATKSKRYASKSSHASDDMSILNMDKELVIQEPPNDPTLCNIPPKKDIVEFDVARVEDNATKKLGLSESELQLLLEQNLDLSPSNKSLIKVKMDGTALRRALKRCGIPYVCPTKTHPVVIPTHASTSKNVEKKGDPQDADHRRLSEQKETAPTKNYEGKTTEEQEEEDGAVDASFSVTESTATALTAAEADQVKAAAAQQQDELEELKVSGDRDLFDELELIVMEGLAKQYWSSFLTSKEYSKLLNFWWYRDRKVVEDDFFLMRVLGRGGFGLVHACKKGTSGKLFAMKVMNKKRIKLKKSEQLTMNERMALAAVDSPFVVKLSYAFQSKDDIFLILDLMTGGDLGFHLHQKGKFSKRECLYFSARIMLGLQAIHDRRYVYRDLKPENVLVGDDGRVKLSDLGLATKVTPTLHGAAGTRGYWAPEMLRRDHRGRRKAYGHTVDWFSFGCCLYEFISGFNPFRSQDALRFGMNEGMDSKERALDCATLKMEPSFDPARFDHDAADLCLKLLDKNEKTRLGLTGCQEIMSHPYYRDMNWEAIISDRMKPPFIPPKDVNAASQSEIGTFAEDRTYHETQMEAEDEQIYKYWDWTNPTAFDAEIIEFLIHERRTGKPLLPSDPMTPCCCSVL